MRTLAAFALLIPLTLVALAAPAQAQYTFQAAGVATQGDQVFRIGITRHPDAQGFPTLGVGITQRAPTVENVFDQVFIEQTWFYVIDNFNTSPGATVNSHYFAFPADPSVDFAFDGFQLGHTVWGTGHYKGYQFVLTADAGV